MHDWIGADMVASVFSNVGLVSRVTATPRKTGGRVDVFLFVSSEFVLAQIPG